jgi:1-aminocyclopropane-1-carboxylate deaminase
MCRDFQPDTHNFQFAMLDYHPTRTVIWNDKDLPAKILVKMECENHPTVSGNKWWKLKYNLEEAQRRGIPILTFGGAYSNHIYATSAAAKEIGLPSIGVIRGEPVDNHVLTFARANGMQLEFVSREVFKNKSDPMFVEGLRKKFGDFFLIPEGGTNEAAIRGCREWGRKLEREIEFDVLCLPVGTGGTMAGLLSGLSKNKSVIGFSALKGGEFLGGEVNRWINSNEVSDWRVETEYHFGGYAKTTDALMHFINDMHAQQDVRLDPVYTAKAMFGVLDLARKGSFRDRSTVLFLHTGGLHTTVL